MDVHGEFLAEIRDNAADAELIGLDLSPAYLAHAEGRHTKAGISGLRRMPRPFRYPMAVSTW